MYQSWLCTFRIWISSVILWIVWRWRGGGYSMLFDIFVCNLFTDSTHFLENLMSTVCVCLLCITFLRPFHFSVSWMSWYFYSLIDYFFVHASTHNSHTWWPDIKIFGLQPSFGCINICGSVILINECLHITALSAVQASNDAAEIDWCRICGSC